MAFDTIIFILTLMRAIRNCKFFTSGTEDQTSELRSAVRPEHLVDRLGTRWYDVFNQASEFSIADVYRTSGFLYYTIMLGEPIRV